YPRCAIGQAGIVEGVLLLRRGRRGAARPPPSLQPVLLRIALGALFGAGGPTGVRGPGGERGLRVRSAEPENRGGGPGPCRPRSSVVVWLLDLDRAGLSRVAARGQGPRGPGAVPCRGGRLFPSPDGLRQLAGGMGSRQPVPSSAPLPRGHGADPFAGVSEVPGPLRGGRRLFSGLPPAPEPVVALSPGGAFLAGGERIPVVRRARLDLPGHPAGNPLRSPGLRGVRRRSPRGAAPGAAGLSRAGAGRRGRRDRFRGVPGDLA